MTNGRRGIDGAASSLRATSIEGTRLEAHRQGERHEHDHRPHDGVDDEVIGGAHGRQGHRRRHEHCEDADGPARRRLEQDDRDEQVPADVQARKRRVLVRERRRLQRAVTVRVLRDRVHETHASEPGRRDRHQGEEREADEARNDHGIAEEEVLLPPPDVEHGCAREDHGPVAVDVDPVREAHERFVAEDERLELSLPGHPQRTLELGNRAGVRTCVVDPSLGDGTHCEVHGNREPEEGGLATRGK